MGSITQIKTNILQRFQRYPESTERSEIDPYKYGQLTQYNFFIKVQKCFNGERIVISASSDGTVRYPYPQESTLNIYPMPYTKINSLWIICPNIKYKPIKHLEGTIGENLCYFESGKVLKYNLQNIHK